MPDPIYFIEVAGQNVRGKWFLEFDRDESRSQIIDTIREYGARVLKVLEVNEDEGTCRDVTDEMKAQANATLQAAE